MSNVVVVIGGNASSIANTDKIVYSCIRSTSKHTHEHIPITVSGGHYQQWLEDINFLVVVFVGQHKLVTT